MKKQICIEVSKARQLREFLNIQESPIEVVTDGPCNVTVVQCEDHKESDLGTIYSGGWITCETARGLAKKLEIPIAKMGKLLNHLDVKVRRCGLGCFK